jgi:CheY-like chemotaxis protein
LIPEGQAKGTGDKVGLIVEFHNHYMKHLKIGIVEDDLLIAESIVMALRQIGYHPTLPARSYEAALKMIESESPDLMLIDISISKKSQSL